MCPAPQLEQKLPLCLIGGRVLRGLCTHTARLPIPSHESPESVAPRIKSPSKSTRPPPRSGVLNRARSYCLVGLVGPQHGSTTIESREGPPVGCGSVQLRRSRHTIRGEKKVELGFLGVFLSIRSAWVKQKIVHGHRSASCRSTDPAAAVCILRVRARRRRSE